MAMGSCCSVFPTVFSKSKKKDKPQDEKPRQSNDSKLVQILGILKIKCISANEEKKENNQQPALPTKKFAHR